MGSDVPGSVDNSLSRSSSRRALSSTGLRTTSQRALILDIIRRGGRHLDADEIYRRARKKEPRISLSTVYRSLLKFKELGLVGEYHFDDSHHHYEVKPSVNHHHLMCLECGRVIEFDYDVLGEVMRQVPGAAGFEITETELRITGYCVECQQKRR